MFLKMDKLYCHKICGKFVLSGKNGQTLTIIPVEKHEKWPRFGQTLLSAGRNEKDVPTFYTYHILTPGRAGTSSR